MHPLIDRLTPGIPISWQILLVFENTETELFSEMFDLVDAANDLIITDETKILHRALIITLPRDYGRTHSLAPSPSAIMGTLRQGKYCFLLNPHPGGC